MIGVVPLYKRYKEHLKSRTHDIAQLQLLGRIEDYLTKEFALVALSDTGTPVLPLLNVGEKADERRIDVALAKGGMREGFDRSNLTVWGFVEVKYLRNVHRFGTANAEDEHEPTFRSLHKQLKRMECEKFARYSVRLRSGNNDTYGLVFASYVCRAADAEEGTTEPDQFFRKIIEKAKIHGFKTSNYKTPRFSEIHHDYPVTLLGGEYLASLRVGLWRLDSGSSCDC